MNGESVDRDFASARPDAQPVSVPVFAKIDGWVDGRGPADNAEEIIRDSCRPLISRSESTVLEPKPSALRRE